MAYTTSRVTYNFTSYTATKTGLYVFTGSCDGGYSVNIGGTSSVLYTNKMSAGTVAFIWAESGQTITCSSAEFGQLVYVDGFVKPPYISLEDQQTTTATIEGLANIVYIGAITGYSHYRPSSLSYSFTCSGASITTVAHPDPDWSRNAMSLIIPNNDAAITVTCNSSEQKQAYIFRLETLPCEIDVTVNPSGSGTISGDGEVYRGETAVLTASANNGHAFENWQLKGYTRLDYIESTGSQYIDTKVQYSNDLIEIEIGLSSTDTPSGTYKTLLGMYTASSNGAPFSIWANSEYGQNFKDVVSGTNYPYAFDGTSQVFTFTNNSRTGSAYNIFLFKANAKGGNTYYGLSELKIEYTKIKVNNKVVRDYIPVIRHKDSAIGLLDLVEFKFYGNSGTGSFIGGDVYAS